MSEKVSEKSLFHFQIQRRFFFWFYYIRVSNSFQMSFAYIYIVPLSILVVYGNILCTYSGYLNAGSRFHAYTIAGS